MFTFESFAAFWVPPLIVVMIVSEWRRPSLDSLRARLGTAFYGIVAAYGFSFIYIYYLNPPPGGSWANRTEVHQDLLTGFILGLLAVTLMQLITAALRRTVKGGPPLDTSASE